MKLIQTNSGNWAKEITITGGGKWRFCNHFATLEQVQAAAAAHAAKGRKTEITEKMNADGSAYYALRAYVCSRRLVRTHASAEECLAAGKTPGACNA